MRINGTGGFTSATGRSHSFDDRADGYARGEAVNVAVHLLRADGALATATGSVVRQDGKSASLTAPNGLAQRALLLACVADAADDPAHTEAVEAHGTGTALGDPIEAGALAGALLPPSRTTPLAVASLKANAGHTEPGAGLSGVAALLVRNGRASPNAHLRVLNPRVAATVRGRLATLPVQVSGATRPFALSGVSSFGYSGTIAHAAFVPLDGAIAPHHGRVHRTRAYAWHVPAHPFLGVAESTMSMDVSSPLTSQTFRVATNGPFAAIVRDHVVQGNVVFPGAGYLETARAAGANAMAHVVFLQPLVLTDIIMEMCVDVHDTGRVEIATTDGEIGSAPLQHCLGDAALAASPSFANTAGVARQGSHVDVGAFYEGLRRSGLAYGPGYRRLTRLFTGARSAHGHIHDWHRNEGMRVHPAVLDAALQIAFATDPLGRREGQLELPFSIASTVLVPARGTSRGAAVQTADSTFDVALAGRSRRAEHSAVSGLRVRVAGPPPSPANGLAYVVDWKAVTGTKPVTARRYAGDQVGALKAHWCLTQVLGRGADAGELWIHGGAKGCMHGAEIGLARSARVEVAGHKLGTLRNAAGWGDHAPLQESELEVCCSLGAVAVARLAREDFSRPKRADICGVHLVTGGTAGVGFVTARWLLRTGATHVAVASRSGRFSPHVDGAMDAMTAARADVAQLGDARALLANLACADLGAVQGFWHAAGVLSDTLLHRQTAAHIEHVFGPKVGGMGFVCAALALRPLRVCVAFSSIVSLLGGAGQANYAAANAELDFIAELRQLSGLPARSVQWGAWKEVGMAARGAAADRVAAMEAASGLGRLTTEQGTGALLNVVGSRSHPVIAVVPIAWSRYSPTNELRALTAQLVPGRTRGTGAQPVPSNANGPAPDVPTVVQVAKEVAGVNTIDADAPIMESGIDSLGAIELRNRLQGVHTLPLPSTLVFDHPTARLIASVYAAAAAPAPSAPSPGRSTAPTDTPMHAFTHAAPCRLPAGITGDAALHAALGCGTDAVDSHPAWEAALAIGSTNGMGEDVTRRVRHSAMIRGSHLFDAALFRVPSAEACLMDPQQRMLLECADSAIRRASMARESCAVHVGQWASEFGLVLRGSPMRHSAYTATSTACAVTCGRLSYVFDLGGACVSYDTACSASLVAHHGARSAARGTAALVAGVNLILDPETMLFNAIAGFTSPGGRSKTFDARADGYARSEAVCLAILGEDLPDGTTRAHLSAVLQDAKSASLTAPNGRAQRKLLASVSSATTARAHEAHGTGTALGDPIETAALQATEFARNACVGALKSSFGHAEPAAGMIGLIHLANSALERQRSGPNAQLRVLNPHIVAQLWLPIAACSLPDAGASTSHLHGGCSSFGYAGTIAHSRLCSLGAPRRDFHEAPARFRRKNVARLTTATATTSAVVAPTHAVYVAEWVAASPRGHAASAAVLCAPHQMGLEGEHLHTACALTALATLLTFAQRQVGVCVFAPYRYHPSGVDGALRTLRLEVPSAQWRMRWFGEGIGPRLPSQGDSEPETITDRHGVVLAPRLRQAPLGRAKFAATPSAGCTLVTGGLGGLGLALASAIDVRMILAARTVTPTSLATLPPAARERCAAVPTDVTCQVHLRYACMGIDSVVHLAGILRDSFVRTLTVESIREVFSPKAGAALTLHRVTSLRPLRAMIYSSSVSGALGNVGQYAYAAASAFLDSMARDRRIRGTRAASVQLPAVSGAGMGASALHTLDDGDWSITPEEMVDYVASCWAQNVVAVFAIIPASLAKERQLPPWEVLRHAEPACARGAGMSVADSTCAIQGIVDELLPGAQTSADAPLMDAGLDSIAATELVSKLRVEFGKPHLAATLLFQHPTLRSLANFMAADSQCDHPVPAGPHQDSGLGTTALCTVASTCGGWAGGVPLASRGAHAKMLSAHGDAVCEVPTQRWSSARSMALPPAARHGGFMARTERFDARAFAISPAEARSMDPQQRLLLHATWSTMHAAGLRRTAPGLQGVGIWLAMERPEWALAQPPAARESTYAATADNVSVASGRLSFTFGLHGPCASIDAACASSLVALHLATRTGGGTAVCASTSLKLAPDVPAIAAAAGMLSRDGRCKTFDAAANGYARGEAVGALYVQRRGEHGVQVLAVVVQQDGRSASLTAPNGNAQAMLIGAAITEANASPGILEAHGTGTALGDPTEAGAVARATRAVMLTTAAAKSQVGHAEAAAGIVGLLRLALRHAANAHLRVMNPLLDAFAPPLCCYNQNPQSAATELTPGVSSFGYSGTISHAILDTTLANSRRGRFRIAFRSERFEWPALGAVAHVSIARAADEPGRSVYDLIEDLVPLATSDAVLCHVGMDSIAAMELKAALSGTWPDVEFPEEIAACTPRQLAAATANVVCAECPSRAAMHRHHADHRLVQLAGGSDQASRDVVIVLHTPDGVCDLFRGLAAHVVARCADIDIVWGIEHAVIQSQGTADTSGHSLTALCDDYATVVSRAFPEKHTHLVGGSYGAAVAFCTGQRIQEGCRALVLIDPPPPGFAAFRDAYSAMSQLEWRKVAASTLLSRTLLARGASATVDDGTQLFANCHTPADVDVVFTQSSGDGPEKIVQTRARLDAWVHAQHTMLHPDPPWSVEAIQANHVAAVSVTLSEQRATFFGMDAAATSSAEMALRALPSNPPRWMRGTHLDTLAACASGRDAEFVADTTRLIATARNTSPYERAA